MLTYGIFQEYFALILQIQMFRVNNTIIFHGIAIAQMIIVTSCNTMTFCFPCCFVRSSSVCFVICNFDRAYTIYYFKRETNEKQRDVHREREYYHYKRTYVLPKQLTNAYASAQTRHGRKNKGIPSDKGVMTHCGYTADLI